MSLPVQRSGAINPQQNSQVANRISSTLVLEYLGEDANPEIARIVNHALSQTSADQQPISLADRTTLQSPEPHHPRERVRDDIEWGQNLVNEAENDNEVEVPLYQYTPPYAMYLQPQPHQAFFLDNFFPLPVIRHNPVDESKE